MYMENTYITYNKEEGIIYSHYYADLHTIPQQWCRQKCCECLTFDIKILLWICDWLPLIKVYLWEEYR